MNREDYWNKQYLQYFLAVADDAEQEGTVTTVQKETAGDCKAPSETALIHLLEILESKSGECLLDYGCGFGRFYPYFKDRSDYYGIDISQAMIAECQRRYPQAQERFLVSEGENLPFSDGFFDKIACVGVFDACYQERALSDMMRVCKVGGEMLITGKHLRYFCDDGLALIAEEAARKKGHPNYFTNVGNMLQQLQDAAVVVENRFFLYRGDFAEGKYVKDMPEEFYEWAVVLKKMKAEPRLTFEPFSDAYSDTWKKLNQVK